ncbi:hypothetical protein PI124_g18482 [Phytophthora idaei]|nr:hypothetical protein PI126_g6059 [Phytophthora idaei]KAG3236512.1 hypothetical protein PI124_g18482 [Phytophthora idaei]
MEDALFCCECRSNVQNVSVGSKDLDTRVRVMVNKLSRAVDDRKMNVIDTSVRQRYEQELDLMKSKIVARGSKCFKCRTSTIDLSSRNCRRVRFNWSSILVKCSDAFFDREPARDEEGNLYGNVHTVADSDATRLGQKAGTRVAPEEDEVSKDGEGLDPTV